MNYAPIGQARTIGSGGGGGGFGSGRGRGGGPGGEVFQ